MKKHWLTTVMEPIELAQKRAIGGKSVIIDMGARNVYRKSDFRMRVEVIEVIGICLENLSSITEKYLQIKKGGKDGIKQI